MSAILTNENFQGTITSSEKPVIIDFYADWCGPCKMMAPIFEELAQENTDVAFYKLDVDKAPDIASKYGVSTIPTFAAFVGGDFKGSVIGAKPKQDIIGLVK